MPVVLFSVYPLLNGIWLGFTDAQAGYQVDYHFNGLDNYVRLLKDDVFWNSFKIGLIWAFSVTILQFVLALGLALLLNAGLRFQWLVRPLALVPWAMPSVIVAILWKLTTTPTPASSTPSSRDSGSSTPTSTGWAASSWPCLRSSSSESGRACLRRPSRCSPVSRTRRTSSTRPPPSTARTGGSGSAR